jgi:hypothetical protein
MQDLLQTVLGILVGEHQLPHVRPIKSARRVNALRTEYLLQWFNRLTTGLGELARNRICIDQRQAFLLQQMAQGRFATPDSARQTDSSHGG